MNAGSSTRRLRRYISRQVEVLYWGLPVHFVSRSCFLEGCDAERREGRGHAWRVRDHRDPERQESWRERGSRLRCMARDRASHASLSVCCTNSISFDAASYLPVGTLFLKGAL